MTNIDVPPLPVTRFAEFKAFYQRDRSPALLIYGEDDYPWVWEDAGEVAANLCFRLGKPSLIAGLEGDDALQYWLSIYNTREWCDLCRKMIAAEPRFLSPRSTNIRRLNAWCRYWLAEFYDYVGSAPATTPNDPAPQSDPAERVAAEPPPKTTDELIARYLASKPEAPSARGLVRFRDAKYPQLIGVRGFGPTALNKQLYRTPGMTLNRGGRGRKG